MKSLSPAYQACAHRVIRGGLDNTPKIAINRSAPREPLLARFGDLHIHTGLKLKLRHAAGKPMAWSPTTGSKP